MKFGKLEDISNVDFSLPEDPSLNSEILNCNKSFAPLKVFIGSSTTGNKEWVGPLYPPGTPQRKMLAAYAKQFNTVEYNTTHYRVPKAEWVAKWRDEVGPDFRFCPKYFLGISHRHRLRNADVLIQDFVDRLLGFEDKLGCPFIQMPPNFTPNSLESLQEFYSNHPVAFKPALELRHEDWFADRALLDDTMRFLAGSRAPVVITDTPGRRDVVHMYVTSPTAFIRFGGNNFHEKDKLRLDEWAKRIALWSDMGLEEVYFMVHDGDGINAPKAARYFAGVLEALLGIQIRKPVFLELF